MPRRRGSNFVIVWLAGLSSVPKQAGEELTDDFAGKSADDVCGAADCANAECRCSR